MRRWRRWIEWSLVVRCRESLAAHRPVWNHCLSVCCLYCARHVNSLTTIHHIRLILTYIVLEDVKLLLTAVKRQQQPRPPLITITVLGGRRLEVGRGWYDAQQRSLVDAAAITVQFNCQHHVLTAYLISGGLLTAVAPGVSVDAGAPLPSEQH